MSKKNKMWQFKNFFKKSHEKQINTFIKNNEIISTSINHFHEFKKENLVQNIENFKTNLLIIANEKHDSELFDNFVRKIHKAIKARKVIIFEKLNFLINWKNSENNSNIAYIFLENSIENDSSLMSLKFDENEKNLFYNFQNLMKLEINQGFGINFFDEFIITKNEKENYKVLFSEKVLSNYENSK